MGIIFNKQITNKSNGINMKTKNYIKFLTVALSLSAVLISSEVYAQDDIISQEKLAQIEERVNNMSTTQLNDRAAELSAEVDELEKEQSSSQSPVRQKAISTRLAEISAEMTAIQKALSLVAGVAAISALTDDDKKDMLPPVVP